MNFQPIVPDDGELLLQLRKGDRIAFDELFNRFAEPIHTYIKMRLNGSEEADDVLQEVFIRLWNKRQSIVIHTSFRNYLYTIVQHCICDHQRASKRKRYTLTAEMPDHTEERPQPDEQYQYKQAYHLWKNATNKLPGQMRRIYSMKNEEQLSVKEIASELQLSEGIGAWLDEQSELTTGFHAKDLATAAHFLEEELSVRGFSLKTH